MLAILAIAGLSHPALTTRQILSKRYMELNAVEVSRNVLGLEAWMAENAAKWFFFRTGQGRLLNGAETIGILEAQFHETVKVERSDFRMTTFSERGKHASCCIVAHTTATLFGKRKFVGSSTSVNTWDCVNGVWKLAGIVTTASSTTINGKPVR